MTLPGSKDTAHETVPRADRLSVRPPANQPSGTRSDTQTHERLAELGKILGDGIGMSARHLNFSEQWWLYKKCRDLLPRIATLEQERSRLVSANEHWHLRVSQLNTSLSAATDRVEELEGREWRQVAQAEAFDEGRERAAEYLKVCAAERRTVSQAMPCSATRAFLRCRADELDEAVAAIRALPNPHEPS